MVRAPVMGVPATYAAKGLGRNQPANMTHGAPLHDEALQRQLSELFMLRAEAQHGLRIDREPKDLESQAVDNCDVRHQQLTQLHHLVHDLADGTPSMARNPFRCEEKHIEPRMRNGKRTLHGIDTTTWTPRNSVTPRNRTPRGGTPRAGTPSSGTPRCATQCYADPPTASLSSAARVGTRDGERMVACSDTELSGLKRLWEERGGSDQILGAWVLENERLALQHHARRAELRQAHGGASFGDHLGFHGTHPVSILSICRHGFVVHRPDDIFTKSPQLAQNECRGGEFLFVCRICIRAESSDRRNLDGDHFWDPLGQYYKLATASQALPQFLLKFGPVGPQPVRCQELIHALGLPSSSAQQLPCCGADNGTDRKTGHERATGDGCISDTPNGFACRREAEIFAELNSLRGEIEEERRTHSFNLAAAVEAAIETEKTKTGHRSVQECADAMAREGEASRQAHELRDQLKHAEREAAQEAELSRKAETIAREEAVENAASVRSAEAEMSLVRVDLDESIGECKALLARIHELDDRVQLVRAKTQGESETVARDEIMLREQIANARVTEAVGAAQSAAIQAEAERQYAELDLQLDDAQRAMKAHDADEGATRNDRQEEARRRQSAAQAVAHLRIEFTQLESELSSAYSEQVQLKHAKKMVDQETREQLSQKDVELAQIKKEYQLRIGALLEGKHAAFKDYVNVRGLFKGLTSARSDDSSSSLARSSRIGSDSDEAADVDRESWFQKTRDITRSMLPVSTDPFCEKVRDNAYLMNGALESARVARGHFIDAQLVAYARAGRQRGLAAAAMAADATPIPEMVRIDIESALKEVLSLLRDLPAQRQVSTEDRRQIGDRLEHDVGQCDEEIAMIGAHLSLGSLPDAYVCLLADVKAAGLSIVGVNGWPQGSSPLHLAAEYGRRDVFEYILGLDGGYDLLSQVDSTGLTPLEHAEHMSQTSLVKWASNQSDILAAVFIQDRKTDAQREKPERLPKQGGNKSVMQVRQTLLRQFPKDKRHLLEKAVVANNALRLLRGS